MSNTPFSTCASTKSASVFSGFDHRGSGATLVLEMHDDLASGTEGAEPRSTKLPHDCGGCEVQGVLERLDGHVHAANFLRESQECSSLSPARQRSKSVPHLSKSGSGLVQVAVQDDIGLWWPSARYEVECAPHVWAMRFPKTPSAWMRQLVHAVAVMKSDVGRSGHNFLHQGVGLGAKGASSGRAHKMGSALNHRSKTSQECFTGFQSLFVGFQSVRAHGEVEVHHWIEHVAVDWR